MLTTVTLYTRFLEFISHLNGHLYHFRDNVTGLEAELNGNNIKLSWNSITPPSGYKESTNGAIVYKIYLDNTYLGETTNNYYTHSTSDPYGTYTVKSAYKKGDENTSSGATYTLEANVNFTYNGTESETIAVGDTYSPLSDPITVTLEGKDVTDKADKSTTITKDGNEVTSIDTSTAGDVYEIKYYAAYKGKSNTYTCTVTIQ